MITGFDVSSHQRTGDLWLQSSDFLIARASYGVRDDTSFLNWRVAASAAHCRAFGGYHFVRQHQDPDKQLEVLQRQLDLADYGVSDLLPAVDVEANDEFDGAFEPGFAGLVAETIVRGLIKTWGGVLLYTNPTIADALLAAGHQWLMDPQVHLWISHWDVPQPRVYKPAVLWQNRVSQHPQYKGAKIDQNMLMEGSLLPLIGTTVEAPAVSEEEIPSTRPSGTRWDPAEHRLAQLRLLVSRLEYLQVDLETVREELAELLAEEEQA